MNTVDFDLNWYYRQKLQDTSKRKMQSKLIFCSRNNKTKFSRELLSFISKHSFTPYQVFQIQLLFIGFYFIFIIHVSLRPMNL